VPDELDELDKLVTAQPRAAAGAIERWLAGAPRSFADRIRSAVLLARAQRAVGDLAGAAATLDGAVALVECGARRGESVTKTALIRSTGETFANHGRAQTGIALCLRLAPFVDEDERIELVLALVALHRDANAFTTAARYAEQARSLIEGRGGTERECRLLNNLGVLKLDIGDYAEAAVDFERAEQLADSLGLGLAAASCHHNRGVALARQGQVHQALELLDQSAEYFERHGHDYALLEALLDRVAVLIDSGLNAEARAAARLSAEAHARLDARAGLERTRHLQSQIEIADGNWRESARYARLVADLIELDDDRLAEAKAWVRLLEFVADESNATLEALDQKGETKDASAAIEIGLHLIRSNRADAARPYLTRLAGEPRRCALSELDRCLVNALLARMDGDAERVSQWVNAGLIAAETNTVCLGATDLRTLARRRISQLGDLGLALALERGSVLEAATIVDRVHAVSLRPEPDLTVVESGLIARLREIRRLEGQYSTHSEEWADLVRERTHLELQLRSNRRHQPGLPDASAAPAAGAETLTHERDTRIFFHEFNGRALVLRLAPGDQSIIDLGPSGQLSRQITALSLLLDAVATASADRDDLVALVKVLSSTLAPVIGSDEPGTLVVVPDARGQLVPWALLTSRPVTLMPTIASMPVESPVLSVDAPVRVIAGPDLEHCLDEVAEIEQAWGAVDCLAGERATVAEALEMFNHSSMVHVSAHGQLRRDNPLFSEVSLFDGPLTFYDLLSTACPPHVVLAACDIGRDSVSSSVGAFSVLHSRGCSSMVAACGQVRDGSIGALMGKYYGNLTRAMRPPAALASAQQELLDEDPSLSLLMCFGPA
jgi:tetratricopeptide (TPR) repeat protein